MNIKLKSGSSITIKNSSGTAIVTVNEDGSISGVQKDQVVANPTLAGTEDALTGLQIGNTKYGMPPAGTKLYRHVLTGTGNSQGHYFMIFTTFSENLATCEYSSFVNAVNGQLDGGAASGLKLRRFYGKYHVAGGGIEWHELVDSGYEVSDRKVDDVYYTDYRGYVLVAKKTHTLSVDGAAVVITETSEDVMSLKQDEFTDTVTEY